MTSSRGTLVYYVVGPVHLRNALRIQEGLPEWEVRIAYEPALRWFRNDRMKRLPLLCVPLVGHRVPDALWSGAVRAALFSSVQPRPAPLALLRSALERGLPTIGLEETNQVALNDQTINNYLLPLDHLLVASEEEREGMVAAGIPERRVEVTGWPFYDGSLGAPSLSRRRNQKARFGLDPDRPVATLALTALGDTGESRPVRERQVALAADGLPAAYQLVVKPHPIEPSRRLLASLGRHASRVHVIDGFVAIDDVLDATDILLNRGTSQVCFEAILREIPVIILDIGVRTPFHRLAPDVVVTSPADLARLLSAARQRQDFRAVYRQVTARHMPHAPDQAREVTCRRIEMVAVGAPTLRDPRQWLDLALYEAWRADRRTALRTLSSDRVDERGLPVESLRKLIQYRATDGDLERLQATLGHGFRSQVLRALWIDQAAHRRMPPAEADIRWLREFPPRLNIAWFVPQLRRWIDILLRSGRAEEATGLIERLEHRSPGFPEATRLAQSISRYQGGRAGRTAYAAHQAMCRLRARMGRVSQLVSRARGH